MNYHVHLDPEELPHVEIFLSNFRKVDKTFSMKIEFDKVSNEPYINFSEDPFVPTFAAISIPDEFVKYYSVECLSVDNSKAFRIEGMYELYEATLCCTICREDYADMSPQEKEDAQDLLYMSLDIKAPTMEWMQKIYSAFRMGKLYPIENWEAQQVEKPSGEDNQEK